MRELKLKNIMLQGTGSSVGKSLLAAGLCRVLRQDGYRVAPFKAQNMALNSFITAEGHEMGRAQVVQAEACGLLPSALMNPILLKPTSDQKAQVIIKGKVFRNMSAKEYHEYKPRLRELVRETYGKLAEEYDLVVIEGAGSPAEINLREHDLVNMGMAEIAQAPVLLIGDIDRGGVFASLYGTVMLLNEEERKRVKGIIINKFRGDAEILKPGIKMLEELIHVPVVGVIPYQTLNIEDEDSVSEELGRTARKEGAELDVAVVKLPRISNYTDFKVLSAFSDVSLRYVSRREELGRPDLLILPGSKNTIEDLLYIRESGLEKDILAYAAGGGEVMGICGGYQMLGRQLSDPCHTESQLEFLAGMGLLDMETVFAENKVTTQVQARVAFPEARDSGRDGPGGLKGWSDLGKEVIFGYEIHMGITDYGPGSRPFIEIESRLGEKMRVTDGVMSPGGNVYGTYIHGVFDNTVFTRKLLNRCRIKKGLAPVKEIPESYKAVKEREYDRLASLIRQHLDMEWVYGLLSGDRA